MLPRNGKGIQPLRKSPFFAGETVGTPACFRAGILANLPASPPALVPAGTQAYRQRHGGKAKADAVSMGQTIGKAVERVAKERHKLPRQRQMLPRNSKEIQPWRKSFSFAGGMVGTPDYLPVCASGWLPTEPRNGCLTNKKEESMKKEQGRGRQNDTHRADGELPVLREGV